MEHGVHPFSELFEQLGLPADSASIQAFIEHHAPLAEDVGLAEAPFWSPSQAELIRSALDDDADWAEVVDQLNTSLRKA